MIIIVYYLSVGNVIDILCEGVVGLLFRPWFLPPNVFWKPLPIKYIMRVLETRQINAEGSHPTNLITYQGVPSCDTCPKSPKTTQDKHDRQLNKILLTSSRAHIPADLCNVYLSPCRITFQKCCRSLQVSRRFPTRHNLSQVPQSPSSCKIAAGRSHPVAF